MFRHLFSNVESDVDKTSARVSTTVGRSSTAMNQEILADCPLVNMQALDKNDQPVDLVLFVVHGIGYTDDETTHIDLKNSIDAALESHYWDQLPIRVETRFILWKNVTDKHIKFLNEIAHTKSFFRQASMHYIGDFVYYMTPHIGEEIITSVVNSLNTEMDQLRMNPLYKNSKFAICAHSLGSAISFEVITGIRLRTGCTGAEIPKLKHKISSLFMWGSPVPALLGLLKANPIEHPLSIPEGTPPIFNMFHTHDPVASRLEPFLRPDLFTSATLPSPMLVPNYVSDMRYSPEERTKIFFAKKYNDACLPKKSSLYNVVGSLKEKIDRNIKTRMSSSTVAYCEDLNGEASVEVTVEEKSSFLQSISRSLGELNDNMLVKQPCQDRIKASDIDRLAAEDGGILNCGWWSKSGKGRVDVSVDDELKGVSSILPGPAVSYFAHKMYCQSIGVSMFILHSMFPLTSKNEDYANLTWKAAVKVYKEKHEVRDSDPD